MPWVWTSTCEEAVEKLKRKIVSPPVLAHFSIDDAIYVTCDASGVAVGQC